MTPVIIKGTTDKGIQEHLRARVQDFQISPLKTGRTFIELRKQYGLTQEELAEKTGYRPDVISDYESLTRATPMLQSMIEQGRLPLGKAVEIVTIRNQHTQGVVAKATADYGLSRTQIREIKNKVREQQGVAIDFIVAQVVSSLETPYFHARTEAANTIRLSLTLISTLPRLKSDGRINRLVLQECKPELAAALTVLHELQDLADSALTKKEKDYMESGQWRCPNSLSGAHHSAVRRQGNTWTETCKWCHATKDIPSTQNT